MGSISLRNAGLVATDTLFSNLNFVIADGDRVGLVAGNGRGKTTLLRAMAGQGELTSGDITRSRGLTVGYVEQDMPPASMGLTLYDAVLEALPPADRDTDSWRVDVVLDVSALDQVLDHAAGDLIVAAQAGTQLGREELKAYMRSVLDIVIQLGRGDGKRLVSDIQMLVKD